MKYNYQVNPRIPVRGLKGQNAIIRPTVLELEKEDAIFCLRFGNVFRRFSSDNMVKVTRANIDELHVPVEKYGKVQKKFAPDDTSVVGNINIKEENAPKERAPIVVGGFKNLDPRIAPQEPTPPIPTVPTDAINSEPPSLTSDEPKDEGKVAVTVPEPAKVYEPPVSTIPKEEEPEQVEEKVEETAVAEEVKDIPEEESVEAVPVEEAKEDQKQEDVISKNNELVQPRPQNNKNKKKH